MNVYDLKDFSKGWFIGDFTPTLLPTEQFEIAIKRYKAGERESKHFHKEADEYTVIISGTVRMNGELFHNDDIIHIEKGIATDFEVISDTITCVVKVPCVKDDKYTV